MEFKKYIKFLDVVEQKKGIWLPENFLWLKDFSLPNIDLGLPSIEKKAKIELIRSKTNPIYIQLSDGSRLFFTFDEFKRITGTPVVGKTITWKTQRISSNESPTPSKITYCRVD